MSWQEAAARNSHRLQLALNVEQFSQQLGELQQTRQFGVSESQLTELASEGANAVRQMQRLEKGEFRIAVVGLEKAGKSTFLNAWLGSDLLPAKSRRCTFTTTQIFSVKDVSEQRLETFPKTDSQFTRLVKDLTEAAGGLDETRAKNAKQDLDTIKRYAIDLKEVLKEGHHTKPYVNLDDIKNDLRKYVADERYAHAMQEVRLYTCRLAEAEGIVFYDVPGLDSGLSKHIEESREMLHDCDAVILVQRNPDLRGAEKDLIKFAREGDHYVKLEDKIFVFFSRMDNFATSDAFRRDYKHVKQTWRTEANLSEGRVVAGSAGAHLVLNGLAEDETLKDIGDSKKVVNDLRRVLSKSDADIDELKNSTGIDSIKLIINNYLNDERVEIVERRCNSLFEEILKRGDEIYKSVRSHIPEDPDEAARRLDASRTRAFFVWWSKKKKNIKADFNEYYLKDLSIGFSDNTLQCFHNRYCELITEGMLNIPSRATGHRDRNFFGSMQHGFDEETANREWREALYYDIRRMIEDIASKLAIELEQDSQKVANFVSTQLWGNKLVTTLLVGDSRIKERLQYSLKTLFLRFVRPVAEALIRAPVRSPTRNNIVADWGVDIDILDYYYPAVKDGGEEVYRQLKRYLRYGVKLLNNPEYVQSELKIKPIKSDKVQAILKHVLSEMNEKSPYIDKQRLVVEEVESDLLALEHYFLTSLFRASGFQAFGQQELENIRDKFLEQLDNGIYDGIASNEWKNGNQKMLVELPDELQSHHINTDVSDRLRQLGSSIQQARNINQVSIIA